MIKLFTEAEFEAARGSDLLTLQCRHCSKPFSLSKTRVKQAMRPSEHSNEYCSLVCANIGKKTVVTRTCAHCGRNVVRLANQAARSTNSFCGKPCAAKYNNAHKTRGTRVSKLERWLQEQLPKLYPDLEFHFNRKDAIEGELDIYIPSLKLAFELNGIFHYEPIYGPEKLASIQSNDGRKYQACLERGIELCIVDTSQMLNFKEKGALKYLSTISSLVDLKLQSR